MSVKDNEIIQRKFDIGDIVNMIADSKHLEIRGHKGKIKCYSINEKTMTYIYTVEYEYKNKIYEIDEEYLAIYEKHNEIQKEENNESTGGPSGYYDIIPKDTKTANDIIEHLAVNRWGAYSVHFKDIFKAMVRWGSKKNTTLEYDAKKIIYSGVRLLRMIVGNEKTRVYLKTLLNDKQFRKED